MKKVVIALAPLALCGCLATQEHIDDLRRQINVLNSSLAVMQKNQADISAKMDVLSKNLAYHAEGLQDFDRQLGKVSSKLDDIETMFGNRFTEIKKTIRSQQDEDVQETLPSKIYTEAYALLLKNSCERAAQGFALYLEKFPKGELAESAQYYAGDAYSGLGKWQEAALAYATALEKYPGGQFAAEARLKYAQCLLKLPGDNKAEAVRYLESVIQDFPDTPQARLAKDKLNELIPPAKPAAKTLKSRKAK